MIDEYTNSFSIFTINLFCVSFEKKLKQKKITMNYHQPFWVSWIKVFPNSFHDNCDCANPCHVLPANSTISFLYLLSGLFQLHLLFLGHHSINFLSHLLSSLPTMSSVHSHFCDISYLDPPSNPCWSLFISQLFLTLPFQLIFVWISVFLSNDHFTTI